MDGFVTPQLPHHLLHSAGYAWLPFWHTAWSPVLRTQHVMHIFFIFPFFPLPAGRCLPAALQQCMTYPGEFPGVEVAFSCLHC